MSILKLQYSGCDQNKFGFGLGYDYVFINPLPESIILRKKVLMEHLKEGEEYFIDLESEEVLSQAHLLKFYLKDAQELYDSIARKHPPAVAAELIKELQTFHDFWGDILADKAYEIMAMYEDREQAKKALNAIQTYYAPIGGSSNAIKS